MRLSVSASSVLSLLRFVVINVRRRSAGTVEKSTGLRVRRKTDWCPVWFAGTSEKRGSVVLVGRRFVQLTLTTIVPRRKRQVRLTSWSASESWRQPLGWEPRRGTETENQDLVPRIAKGTLGRSCPVWSKRPASTDRMWVKAWKTGVGRRIHVGCVEREPSLMNNPKGSVRWRKKAVSRSRGTTQDGLLVNWSG